MVSIGCGPGADLHGGHTSHGQLLDGLTPRCLGRLHTVVAQRIRLSGYNPALQTVCAAGMQRRQASRTFCGCVTDPVSRGSCRSRRR